MRGMTSGSGSGSGFMCGSGGGGWRQRPLRGDVRGSPHANHRRSRPPVLLLLLLLLLVEVSWHGHASRGAAACLGLPLLLLLLLLRRRCGGGGGGGGGRRRRFLGFLLHSLGIVLAEHGVDGSRRSLDGVPR